jgi:hypothetical protein
MARSVDADLGRRARVRARSAVASCVRQSPTASPEKASRAGVAAERVPPQHRDQLFKPPPAGPVDVPASAPGARRGRGGFAVRPTRSSVERLHCRLRGKRYVHDQTSVGRAGGFRLRARARGPYELNPVRRRPSARRHPVLLRRVGECLRLDQGPRKCRPRRFRPSRTRCRSSHSCFGSLAGRRTHRSIGSSGTDSRTHHWRRFDPVRRRLRRHRSSSGRSAN